MIRKTGYGELLIAIDHAASNLTVPNRSTLLQATFPSLSGAAKLAFPPATGPFADMRRSAIIAMSGDRAPFATNGEKLIGPVGYKVMRVDVDKKQMTDFIRNTRGVPAHRLGKNVVALERPLDVKFDPTDGSMLVL